MTLEIRLLGGFDVRRDGGDARFESQKVRGLLAYLACHAETSIARERLIELFWPESEADAGRRNLRQALYNLRQGLGDDGRRVADAEGANQAIRFELLPDDSLDVAQFLAAVRRGLPAAGSDPVAADLVRAARLYRGDLLAGFSVRGGGIAFEDWLVGEQERLRESALQALRSLVDHFAARGEYDAALVYGRRLIEVDPLSEEAHREVMRLYVLAGRRRRALTEYEELADLLARELGVEPLPETRSLYEGILAEDLPGPKAQPQTARTPLGPFVPMVGRAADMGALTESLESTLAGSARLALVDGEPGVGKTRLLKSFLDGVTSKRRAVVAQGRCFGPEPGQCAQPMTELARALGQLLAGEEPLGELSGPVDADAAEEAGDRLEAAVAAYFTAVEGEGDGVPLILFVDDLHWAPRATVERLSGLLERFADRRLWIAASANTGDRPPAPPLALLVESPAVDRIRLSRLDDAGVDEIAATLVGEGDDARRLAEHLAAASEGLPLAVVEHVNLLCDQGVLVPASRMRWRLDREPEPFGGAAWELDAVIGRRIGQLPTSTRRLLVLAAIIGQTFDVEMLQRAAREHVGVVEIGIELMLERWLIRQYARRWSEGPRERDLVLWAQGARRGTFEFAHERIRDVAYGAVNPLRRRMLHRQVADALAERHPLDADDDRETERVAHHYVAAGEWTEALPYLRKASQRAERLGDPDGALAHAARALEVIERLAKEHPDAAESWDEARVEMRRVHDRLAGSTDER